MKFEKLKIKKFKKSALSFDSLKSLLGGAYYTAVGGGPTDGDGWVHDFVNDEEQTIYHDGKTYEDGCGPTNIMSNEPTDM